MELIADCKLILLYLNAGASERLSHTSTRWYPTIQLVGLFTRDKWQKLRRRATFVIGCYYTCKVMKSNQMIGDWRDSNSTLPTSDITKSEMLFSSSWKLCQSSCSFLGHQWDELFLSSTTGLVSVSWRRYVTAPRFNTTWITGNLHLLPEVALLSRTISETTSYLEKVGRKHHQC